MTFELQTSYFLRALIPLSCSPVEKVAWVALNRSMSVRLSTSTTFHFKLVTFPEPSLHLVQNYLQVNSLHSTRDRLHNVDEDFKYLKRQFGLLPPPHMRLAELLTTQQK